MSESKRWTTDFIRDGYEPRNPLAMGVFCPECGTRLVSGDKGDKHPCPICPPEDAA